MARKPNRDNVYAAADIFRRQCFGSDGSFLWHNERIWTAEHANSLLEALTTLDRGGLSFQDALPRAIVDESLKKLALEALFLYYLFPADTTVRTSRKIERLATFASAAGIQLPEDNEWTTALSPGIGNPGPRYTSGQDRQVRYMLALASACKRLGAKMDDPQRVNEISMETAQIAPEALEARAAILHLFYPDDFEPILSAGHKQAIIMRFREVAESARDVDQKLFLIQQHLAKEHGHAIDFYAPQIYALWMPEGDKHTSPATSDEPTETPPASPTVKWWIEKTIVSGRPDKQSGPAKLGEGLSSPERGKDGRDIYWAMRDVQPGDVVLHLTDNSAFTGISRAAGSALPHPVAIGADGQAQSGLLVPLRNYEPLDQPISREAWQREPYASELKAIRLRHSNLFYTSDLALGQGQYLTECPPELASVLDSIYFKLAGKHLTDDVQVRAPDVLLTSQALQRLRDDTLWSDEQLDELLTLLRAPQKQLVLAGPPGTSKTWVLRKAINYLTNDNPRRYKLVQFHPSYSYEQFVEGIMPVPAPGGLTFRLEPGIVKQMVTAMQGDDDDYYILIDEINRANLPSVFGELLMLFEYRDEPITLAHSGEFSLPDNLHFSGTMNTADRSIRSIDAAFRRRFEILECLPKGEMLDSYYAGRINKVQALRSGFESLNARLVRDLRGKHFQVGHAYFMQPEMDSAALRAIWTRKVFPLLEEYFFDEPELLTGYTLEAFWPHA